MLKRTFAGSVSPRLFRCLGWRISPGKHIIFPCATAAFTLPQRSGRALSCCTNSPWGPALICSFYLLTRGFALGLLSDTRSPLRPCHRLVLFKLFIIMTTLQTRGLSPHKTMPMSSIHKEFVRMQTTLRFVCTAQLGRWLYRENKWNT
jgi:hypothetical protein